MAKTSRKRLLQQLFLSRHPLVILTSYQLFSNMTEDFLVDDDSPTGDGDRVWDYVILDEGHIIKNPQTKLCKAVFQVSAKHRLILTGDALMSAKTIILVG